MLAIDVMTTPVVSASPEMPVSAIARLMLKAHISAVPILDEQQGLVGIVTQRDLLRRSETGTEHKRRRWTESFMDGGTLAAEYVVGQHAVTGKEDCDRRPMDPPNTDGRATGQTVWRAQRHRQECRGAFLACVNSEEERQAMRVAAERIPWRA